MPPLPLLSFFIQAKRENAPPNNFPLFIQAWVWKTQADFADALCEEDKPKQEVVCQSEN